MQGFDGLAVVEAVLGLPRVQACKPPFVPEAQPGPCPKAARRLRRLGTVARQRIAVHRPARGRQVAGYTAPQFKLPPGKQPAWDAAVRDAVSADYSSDLDAEGKQAAQAASDAFRDTLSPAQARRFDQEKAIAVRQEQWRLSSPQSQRDTPQQMREKMAESLRQLWGGKKIAIRVTPQNLDQVLGDGRFRTVHETGRTGGFNNPRNREDLEEQLFGIAPATGHLDLRPVYGYVAINGIRRQGADSALGAYGSVQVVLKDQVRARTTASNGDSMRLRNSVRPSPVDDPQHWSYWTQQQSPGQYGVDGERLMNANYAEAQIHGGVSADDIEEVVYSRQPEPEQIQALAERGIPWRIVN